MKPLIRYNTWTGWILLAIFLGTGMYLSATKGSNETTSMAEHMMLRANHIYILMCALIHLLAGANMKRTSNRRKRKVYWLNSALLTMGSVLLLVAFAYEPGQITLDRPITAMGLYFIFTGSLLTVLMNR